MIRLALLQSARQSAFARVRVTSQRRYLQGLVVGVPKETQIGELRVSLIPDDVQKLKKAGATVLVEPQVGVGSGWSDDDYVRAGAQVATNLEVWKSQVVAKVLPPTMEEAQKLEDRTVLSIIQARTNEKLIDQLSHQGATVIALDSLLRTLSRGQAFDVLSSQAKVAGDRAVMEAAACFQRPFGGQTTAAMTCRPAKVLVVGAGVAGLAALQQAKKFGALVYGFDVRAAAKEQVESCGAKFLSVQVAEDGSGTGPVCHYYP
jgi:H+-translocating NAD(P) transhydrogenase